MKIIFKFQKKYNIIRTRINIKLIIVHARMQFNFIFKQPGYNHEKLSKMNNFDNFTFFVQYFFFLFYADMGAHKYILRIQYIIHMIF